jgi:hypothetical protein
MGVLVLGMHRSGTSALAGALEAMGFEVGPDDDVMPADIGNPEGYFELLSIVRANDDLLAHFGGRWDSPPILEERWTEDVAATAFVDAERTTLAELFEGDHYLLKDPRISILLPLWRRITNDRDCAVVIVRDPLEVAASLTRRNGLPTLTGLALWAHYNRSMLRDLEGARVHVCNYADLIGDPTEVLTDIVASLRAWGEVPEDLDLAKAIGSVHPELRRNTVDGTGTDAAASPVEIDELMKRTMDLRGRHDEFKLGNALVPAWWEGPLLEERRLLLQWALGAIAQLETHGTQLESHSANLLAENEILRQRTEEANHEADELREHLDRIRRMVPGPIRRVTSKFRR